MKYWFFSILLANLIFLLWEFHYGAFERTEPANPDAENAAKQILLLGEAGGATAQQPLPKPTASESAASGVLPDALQTAPNTAQDGGEKPAAVESAVPATVEIPAPVQAPTENMAAAAPSPPAENAQTAPATPELAQPAPAIAQAGSEQPSAAEAGVAAVQTPAQEQAAPEITAAVQPPAASETAQAAVPAEQPPQGAQTGAKAGETGSAASAPAEAPKPAVMHTVCYALGAVKNPGTLNALLDRYRPQFDSLKLSTRQKRKNDSYLVYYPPAATLEESIATAESLRADHGVNDLLVFRNGELKGAISLGVFSNEERARIAQSQLEKKGVNAKIMPRYPLETAYSLRARWSEQQDAAAKQLPAALKKAYPAMRQAASCD